MTPDITVGLPVRNGAPEITRAVNAISSQTYGNFTLLISDNASSDDTPFLCERLAADDPSGRIQFTRHASDLGALANFRFILDAARTPFFMWAAHDDWLEPDGLARCRAALLDRSEASAALPETLIHAPDGSARRARGAAPIEGPTAFRIARFLARPSDNSRFYGLYRTDVLQRSFPRDLADLPAADWVISALSLVHGSHVAATGARLHRQGAEPQRYARQARKRLTSPLHRLFPTAIAMRELLRHLPPILRLTSVPSLLLMASHQAIRHAWVLHRAREQ